MGLYVCLMAYVRACLTMGLCMRWLWLSMWRPGAFDDRVCLVTCGKALRDGLMPSVMDEGCVMVTCEGVRGRGVWAL